MIGHRMTIGASAIALVAMALLAPRSYAQKGGTGLMNDEVTWPTTFTLGFGGAANANWQGSGTFSSMPTDGSVNTDPQGTAAGQYGYNQSHVLVQPEFHILAEIPIAKNWMFAPRISYNDYSLRWDQQASTAVAGVGNQALVASIANIGADLLFKYAFSNFHVMAGANLATPIHDMWYAHSQNISDAVDQKNVVPNEAKFLAALKGGVGYDIPLNAGNTIWLTPEAFFSYPVTDYVQDPNPPSNNRELFPVTLSGGASLKFALGGGTPPPPPPVALAASITAHGIMPDGSITAEPVSPQQALHTRSSIPLLPYIFFDDNSSVISARYSRTGATGYSEQSSLSGKDALQANHELLDVVGERMKNNPSLTLRLTGTNANAKEEKNNIALSKARATAVADYLTSTWGIDRSRITVDQRNLPELPTNPVTKAGMQENRRVEISSTSTDLTAPVKIENRQALSVGPTEVRYDMTVTPDPSTHTYANWTVTLDKDGVQLGTPISGTGAPPASTTTEVPDASKYMNQPVHYTLVVTDAQGQTAKADGYTRIVPKTVDRDDLEKFAMLSFDFDRADINQRAHQMLQLISESVSRDATGVKIDGYCDQTGTAEYNQTLSEARANAAVTALRSMTSLPANVTVHGHGFRDLRFDNDLPEGRQLDRRVEITIEKSSR
ncbi:MAG: OmpA family protein [Bacteroidota bacterium]|nr:OmpA family protein [Bacteroidota bacterium]MDP4231989.1 OmpA family protein [Bacteroidota bacterium]MDP4287225.1 OmpA family protein [Bacteroidota bacterium]